MKFALPNDSEVKVLIGGRIKVTHADGNKDCFANEELFKDKFDVPAGRKFVIAEDLLNTDKQAKPEPVRPAPLSKPEKAEK